MKLAILCLSLLGCNDVHSAAPQPAEPVIYSVRDYGERLAEVEVGLAVKRSGRAADVREVP